MNSISMIVPYKKQGMWMFDDERVGLVEELFVAGADVIMEQISAHIPDAESGFRLIFSSTPFPGHQARMEWLRYDEDNPGNWYRWTGTDLEGWLCPALFKYFDEAPKNIYIKVEALEQNAG
jgi:hypothetical protein